MRWSKLYHDNESLLKISTARRYTTVFSKPAVYNTIIFNTAIFFWFRYTPHPYYGHRCLTSLSPHHYDLIITDEHYHFMTFSELFVFSCTVMDHLWYSRIFAETRRWTPSNQLHCYGPGSGQIRKDCRVQKALLSASQCYFACKTGSQTVKNSTQNAPNLTILYSKPHYNRFTALFPGPPGWASARRELLDFMVQGKINRGRHTDHPAGCHSIQAN